MSVFSPAPNKNKSCRFEIGGLIQSEAPLSYLTGRIDKLFDTKPKTPRFSMTEHIHTGNQRRSKTIAISVRLIPICL